MAVRSETRVTVKMPLGFGLSFIGIIGRFAIKISSCDTHTHTKHLYLYTLLKDTSLRCYLKTLFVHMLSILISNKTNTTADKTVIVYNKNNWR